jgi:glutamate N-acetyltransferase/amino-acid N-acetyltransferase
MNDVKSAPVLLSQEHDRMGPSKRAVLINSGAANAFTGRKGLSDARACATSVAEALGLIPAQVYIGSTGSIGVPLPLTAILSSVGDLAAAKGADERRASDFARAIITTDTRPKQASIQYGHESARITIAACLKGAGMIMPNMATMLCIVATDAAISPDMMHAALREAVEDTFHHATVDGDTSTNDTVFLLANGRARNAPILERDASYRAFAAHLTALLEHMVKEMIRDGEGMTKFITIHVRGVPTPSDGKLIAFSIANSPLVKTALFGEQMNWGRLMMAAGKARTGLDFSNVGLSINKITVLVGSEIAGPSAVSDAAATIKGSEIEIELDLNQGGAAFTAFTCDFSVDYVKINANYLT